MTPSLDGEPDSDDLNDIIDTPAPPDIPIPEGVPPIGNFIDTDQVLILNRADTSQGKFHLNLIELHLTDNLESSSSTNLAVDANGSGVRTILGSLIYYAFDARQGSFVSGARNFTLRLDWISSSDETQAGISAAKSRGYTGRVNDTKNTEVTAIFRIRNLLNEQVSHHDASIKARGGTHSDTIEKTLQAGGRMPYTTKGRHNDLYGVEYTHPSYQYENVTFVSPYSSSNYPLITVDQWFGLKFVIYNVNNNQTVHAEMWVDPSPINAAQNGYNNNWEKVWVYEQSGSQAPTWSGPRTQFRTNLAQDVDVIAYNIHEIIPPTTTSSIFSAVELAERAEFEESTGMRHPIWIEQMEEPIDESNNTTQEVPPTIGILEDNIDAVGDYVPEKTDFLVPETTLKPVKKSIESEPKEAFYDDGDDIWQP
jgi:hypothetical protein